MRISKMLGGVLAMLSCATALSIPRTIHSLEPLKDGENLSSTSSLPPGLAPRQAGAKPADSCECKKKCPTKRLIIDPNNCSRCRRCPANQVADPTWKTCVPAGSDQDKNRDKDKDKPANDEEKKKRREEKEKKYPEKKKYMKQRHDKFRKERNFRQNNRRIMRLALCVPIAPLGMGTDDTFAMSVADEFFDEEFLDGGLLGHWPEDMDIPEAELDIPDQEEVDFFTGELAGQWVDYADKTWPRPVCIVGISCEGSSEKKTRSEKRFLGGLSSLGNLGKGASAAVGAAAKGIASRVAKAVPRIRPRPAPGMVGKRVPWAQQSAKVKEMLDKGPMRWCLDRRNPRNHR